MSEKFEPYHSVTKVKPQEDKVKEMFEDFTNEFYFYINLKKLGYHIAFSYYKFINPRRIEVHFNLVWGDIQDKDFHRQECSEIFELDTLVKYNL